MPDLSEAIGQNMLYKALEENNGRESLSSPIFCAKNNSVFRHIQQSRIGNSNTMSVPAEILKRVLRKVESAFQINYPILILEGCHQGPKSSLTKGNDSILMQDAQSIHHFSFE